MDMLEQEFQVLTAIEQGKVIGGGSGSGGYYGSGGGMGSGGPGDYVDSLLNGSDALFNTAGLTDNEKSTLRSSLINIENTSIGNVLLHDLQASWYLSSTGAISISHEDPSNNEVDGSFSMSSHSINLRSNLFGQGNVSSLGRVLIHEVSHADLDVNGENAGTESEEAQAYLVMGEFARENNPQAHLQWCPTDSNNPTSTSGAYFNDAATCLTNNGFDNTDFNVFAEYFKEGSSMNQSGIYNDLTDYDINNPETDPYVSTLFSLEGNIDL